jgi:hypothetical protein
MGVKFDLLGKLRVDLGVRPIEIFMLALAVQTQRLKNVFGETQRFPINLKLNTAFDGVNITP